MDVSENSGTPKSSILIEFSIINDPFWGTPIFGNTQINDIILLNVIIQFYSIQLAKFHRHVTKKGILVWGFPPFSLKSRLVNYHNFYRFK